MLQAVGSVTWASTPGKEATSSASNYSWLPPFRLMWLRPARLTVAESALVSAASLLWPFLALEKCSKRLKLLTREILKGRHYGAG